MLKAKPKIVLKNIFIRKIQYIHSSSFQELYHYNPLLHRKSTPSSPHQPTKLKQNPGQKVGSDASIKLGKRTPEPNLEPEIPKLDEKYHESLDKKPEHLDVKPEPSEKAVKKRRIYENAAPVYDNRQIYAADLLQTQLDYPGQTCIN